MYRWGILISFFLLLQLAIQSDFRSIDYQSIQFPTSGDSEVDGMQRELWLNTIHRAAPGINWREIEYKNQINQFKSLSDNIELRSDCNFLTLRDEQLVGEWYEKGSVNQTGSVFDAEYDPVNDKIFLISAGGTLWKRSLLENDWELINQKLRFSPGVLKFIPTSSGRRLIAFINRIPHFSNDDGYTWKPASGITYSDAFGNFSDVIVIEHDKQVYIYCLAKTSYRDDIILYQSRDLGLSYQPIKDFDISDFNQITLISTHFSDKILCLFKEHKNGKLQLSKIDPVSNDLVPITPFDSTFSYLDAPVNLRAWQEGKQLNLLAYQTHEGNSVLYQSIDKGASWQEVGFLPTIPWKVGLYISPSNPKHLFYGEVDCFRSTDGGKTWNVVNPWWEYYNDVRSKLHADIMNFAEFVDKDKNPFLLVSHHGGLSISYDQLATNSNLSVEGLYVSQYYSIRTSPNDNSLIYAGSQDQGLQFTDSIAQHPSDLLRFKQITPGDFGHILFTNRGQSLWASYPGGSIFFYENAKSGKITTSYTLDSSDESVWLTPIKAPPNSNDNIVYMAGGNIEGENGSYLIELKIKNQKIIANQFPFDFKEASAGGVISALAFSPINPDLWYIATTNGRFFTSEDAGTTWTQNIEFIPNGQYLYGQTILPSSIDEDVVYLGGSGYSNPSVLRSNDKGFTFIPLVEGLPNTLITEMTSNEDESLLFAASEAGPFVYNQATKQWTNMTTPCVPNQTFWSVEYITDLKTVRFGTYGRGIWDFKIDRFVTNTTSESFTPISINVYPNPTTNILNIELPSSTTGTTELRIYDINHRLISSKPIDYQSKTQIPVEDLINGLYQLVFINRSFKTTKSVIISR